jgi:uncharacterized protein (DUF1697 family)
MLRGINVSGQKSIKMQRLKELCESIGFSDVATYIQSGNVVSKSKERNPAAVSTAIVRAIEKKFGFNVTVIVRQPNELAAVIRKNPFIGGRGVDESRLYVTFLEATSPAPLVRALGHLTAKSKDEYKVVGTEIYLHCPHGYGKTLLSNTFFEKHLKVAATTRNWKTVSVLYEMASGLERTQP